MAKNNALDDLEEFIAEQLDAIDNKIQEIDSSRIVRAAQKLLDEKAKLQSARRALLGAGSKTVNSGGPRVTQGEIVAWFEANEGAYDVVTIANSLGYTPEVVRGHLNRGKGERFNKHADNTWSLRDPEEDDD